jgi:hypothetical protein
MQGRLVGEMTADLFPLQTMIGLADGSESAEPRSRLAGKYIGPHFFHSKRYRPHPPPPPVRGGGGGLFGRKFFGAGNFTLQTIWLHRAMISQDGILGCDKEGGNRFDGKLPDRKPVSPSRCRNKAGKFSRNKGSQLFDWKTVSVV